MISLFAVADVLLKTLVFSGTVYVNGVRADGLRDFELENVDVRIDAKGDIHIDAPGYKVEVLEEAKPTMPTTSSGIPVGQYWLATVDESSRGFVADLLINGTFVRKLRSQEEQVILDIGPYLKPGENSAMLVPSGASGTGKFTVYLGTGANEAGTVVLDEPSVIFTLTPQNGSMQPQQSILHIQ